MKSANSSDPLTLSPSNLSVLSECDVLLFSLIETATLPPAVSDTAALARLLMLWPTYSAISAPALAANLPVWATLEA
jgi:hypothetical protein